MNDFKVDQFFCDAFDIVAVGDVNTDGRFLLKRLVERPEGCNIQKLIMITTNRVDFGVGGIDQEQFFRLLDKAAINPKITWVSNNPWYIKINRGSQSTQSSK